MNEIDFLERFVKKYGEIIISRDKNQFCVEAKIPGSEISCIDSSLSEAIRGIRESIPDEMFEKFIG